jgi:hypothetical protein
VTESAAATTEAAGVTASAAMAAAVLREGPGRKQSEREDCQKTGNRD